MYCLNNLGQFNAGSWFFYEIISVFKEAQRIVIDCVAAFKGAALDGDEHGVGFKHADEAVDQTAHHDMLAGGAAGEDLRGKILAHVQMDHIAVIHGEAVGRDRGAEYT